MRQSVNTRSITPGQTQRLFALRRFARLLDSAFVVPGTRYRVGLDPFLGLLPGIGDLVSPLFAIGVLWQAHDLGVPRVVQLRMIFNVAIDSLLGALPFIGDLFDFAFKAQTRNLALLDAWLQTPQATERRSRRGMLLVPVVVLLVFSLLTVLGVWMLYLAFRWLLSLGGA